MSPRSWRTMFTRKSIAQIRADAQASRLQRALGRRDLIVLGVGAVIGSGIYVMPGYVAAKHAGPAVVLSFLIAGVAAALAALCYAEFASLTPVSGSAYTYAYATMGEMPAWVIGWGLLLEYTLGSSLVALGWAAYLGAFIDRTFHVHVAGPTFMHAGAVFATIAAVAILCAGIRRSAYATAVFVLIKLAVILLFLFFGLPFINSANWHPFIPAPTGAPAQYGWSGVFRGASILFVAYIGFDAVTTAAQEARDPQRDVPVAVLASLGVSAAIYAAVALVLTGLIPYRDLAVSNPVAEAIHVTGVRWVGVAVELGAIAALSSVLLVILFGQARILLAMSRDGLLPRALSTVHPRTSAPVVATLVTGTVVVMLTFIGSLESISELATIGTFLAFCIVCIGIPILRHTDPDMPRTFRVPASPWLPLTGAMLCIYLVSALPPRTWQVAATWFAIGMVVYLGTWVRRGGE